jgi:hypothetical protein
MHFTEIEKFLEKERHRSDFLVKISDQDNQVNLLNAFYKEP